MRIIFLWVIIFSIVTGCNNNNTITKASANIDSPQNKADVLRVNMDTAVNPSDDFFMYANGGWIKSNPIPADQGSWSIGNLVIEENLKRLRSISEKAAATKAAPGSAEQKIGDYWSTAMDSARIESQGLQPLKPYLDKINAITDIKTLVATVAELKKIGSSTLFTDYVAQDDKNSDVMSYKLVQGGIGLPEREYYFKTDSTTSNIRTQYVNYITRTLIMSGEDSTKAIADAKNILSLETKLAKASRKIEDLRDPYANYNKMALSDLPKMSPNIDWSLFLNNTGVKSLDSVIVGQPEFFKALSSILKTTPM